MKLSNEPIRWWAIIILMVALFLEGLGAWTALDLAGQHMRRLMPLRGRPVVTSTVKYI